MMRRVMRVRAFSGAMLITASAAGAQKAAPPDWAAFDRYVG